jgi:hypothetical protein
MKAITTIGGAAALGGIEAALPAPVTAAISIYQGGKTGGIAGATVAAVESGAQAAVNTAGQIPGAIMDVGVQAANGYQKGGLSGAALATSQAVAVDAAGLAGGLEGAAIGFSVGGVAGANLGAKAGSITGQAAASGLLTAGETYVSPTIGTLIYNADPSLWTPSTPK